MNRNQIASQMYGKFVSDLNPNQRDVVDTINESKDLKKLLESKED